MNADAFRQEAAAEGYGAVIEREMAANHVEDRHSHEFGAKILVLDGEISVALDDGSTTTCRAGDVFALDAGIPHMEKVGPDGVRFLAARR